MEHRIFILFCFVFLTYPILGQENIVTNDSLQTDSISIDSVSTVAVKPVKKKKRKDHHPSPKKALILSLAIPGAGQIYNKKYWKAPIAMGGVGLMIYFATFNSNRYHYYRVQLIKREDGDPFTIDDFEVYGWEASDIRQRKEYFQKNMELSYIGILLVQVLGAVDAFVDAHLMNFDVNDDLTMKISPKVEFTPFETSTLGIGMSLHLKQKNNDQPKDFFALD